ncbi:MAG: cytochrome c3 family protein [Acidobacteriota bacterium]
MQWRTLLLSLALVVVIAPRGPVTVQADESTTPGADLTSAAEIVETCAGCHEIDGPGYAKNPHAVFNTDAQLAAHYGVESSCTACHGDFEAHVESAGEDGTILAFGGDDSFLTTIEACTSCHADAHPRFLATGHAAAGVACTDCHDIHASGSAPGLLSMPDEGDLIGWDQVAEIGAASATCADCHSAVMAQFDFNEAHRLREGVISCIDCHDPHAPQARVRLAAFKQDQCTTCHADKSGPWVFEHGAQRVEGCGACHSPHGSPNRHLLAFQNQAELCYSCHAAVPGFHTRFVAESQCTNCHVTIHGSNFDPAFLE